MSHPTEPAPQELWVPSIRFLREQDGEPERLLKSRLIEVFLRDGDVQRAYLAQISVGDHVEVALCVRNVAGPNRDLVREVGGIFAEMFGAHEHLDMVFLSDAQEPLLVAVCPPFFPAGARASSA